jgi:phosphoheptose isomerase
VIAFGKPDDILLGISTSGNSKNVINAIKTANALGLKTIGLTGANGGRLSGIANISINAPAENVARIQELHLPIYHAICAFVEDQIFS